MKILLLGSGGREHTFAWKIAQSPLLTKLYIAPGNGGTSQHGENVNIQPTDFEKIREFVISNQIEMVLVGPEDPLVKGIYDYFLADDFLRNIPVIGPSAEGAKLEGSKDFAKQFMIKYGIPTAGYQTFSALEYDEACAFVDTIEAPYVLKADGLAAGKGVLILDSANEAKKELNHMLLEKKFGKASEKVVIEAFLKGIELSVFVITDGEHYILLPEAKDYKRIGEGDTGPNTGGMGTVSGVPFATPEFMKKVEDSIIIPTINGLKKEGITYKGFIFFGLMNVKGNPFVIEYNVRMGDPETESVLPRLQNDFVQILQAIANGQLQTISVQVDSRKTATVMLVSDGYPGNYIKGHEIFIPPSGTDGFIFHAGTSFDTNGKLISNGGRVLAVTSLAETLEGALLKSYKQIEKIHFNGMKFRRDIGLDVINK